MALTARHQFVNAHADEADATVSRPSDWNADHVIAGGTKGALLVFDATQTTGMNMVAAVAVGQVLVSAGTTTLPAWSASPTLTSVTTNQISGASGSYFLVTNPGGSQAWGMSYSAPYQWYPFSDNAQDLAVSTNRIRTGYFGTSVVVPLLQAASSGTADLTLASAGVSDVNLSTNGSTKWRIGGASSAGHLLPVVTTNTVDIGSSSALVRAGYFGTALVVGTNPASTGDFRAQSGFTFKARNAANTADITVLTTDGNNNAQIGTSLDLLSNDLLNVATVKFLGTTASFPMLKRDTVFLQLRLADDSGVTGAVTASLPSGGAGRDGNIGFDTTLNAFVYYVGGNRYKLVGTSF